MKHTDLIKAGKNRGKTMMMLAKILHLTYKADEKRRKKLSKNISNYLKP
tara:strand:+ start:206 stop:352 length:147 start_codon:yes stop_codon:yes gene_type:complete